MPNEQLEKLEDKIKEILSKSKTDISEQIELWSNVGCYLHSKVEERELELLNAKNKLPKKG